MYQNDPLDVRDLELFVSEDEEVARKACGRLCDRLRPFLRTFLIQNGTRNPQDTEEILQNTFLKIWSSRSNFTNLGPRAWRVFAARIAFTSRIDFIRTQTNGDSAIPSVATSYDSAVSFLALPEEDLPDVEEIVVAAAEAEWLYGMADALWLELDLAIPPEVHNRRLLAALMFYVDRLDWQTILRQLNAGSAQLTPITREVLDSWLTDRGVLRHLAYHELYYSNARLATHLLALPPPADKASLDRLLQQARAMPTEEMAFSGRTWGEVCVVLWRYHRALLLNEILRLPECVYSSEELRALFDRCALEFPFQSIMENLIRRLGGTKEAQKRFGDRGLWKRLALQYRFQDRLAHEDILHRTADAALQVQSSLNMGILNAWLSNGRIYTELAAFCRDKLRS